MGGNPSICLELSATVLRCAISLIWRRIATPRPFPSFPPSTPRIFGDLKQQQLNKSKLWEKFPMCRRIFPSLDNNKYKSPSKQVEKMHPYTSMVSSSFGLCFIFFTLVIVSSFSFSEIHAQGYHPYQREFDYFALALQWPGTYCQKTKYCCPTNGCCRGSDSSVHFTIHGLWPDYNDGTWPACCTKSRFDEKEISSLLGALQEYWPSLSCGKTSTCSSGRGLFWAHEWEKHGTCSSPVFRDEYNYFLATLNLYFKYNITEILSEAGIVPSYSEKYPLGAVVSAIENAVGASPLLVCSNGNVQELRICFYKDFKPRDCIIDSTGQNHDLASRSSCPRYVGLPKFMPLELDNQEEAALPL